MTNNYGDHARGSRPDRAGIKQGTRRISWGTDVVLDNGSEDSVFGVTDALQALGELAENTSDAIVRQRASERMQIRTKVLVRPGNSSQRHAFAIEGLTGDISNGGCQILMEQPALVGDLYWLAFSDEHVAIGSLLARCLRCRLVREDTFEAGFRFLHEIDLASALEHQNDHQW